MTSEPPVTIVGGAGGHAAVLEDLQAAAAILVGAAGDLREADRALALASSGFAGASPAGAASLAAAADAMAHARWGPEGTRTLEREVADVADRLRRVAGAFLQAEGAAARHVDGWQSAARAAVEVHLGGLRLVGIYDATRRALAGLVAVAEAGLREERLVDVSGRRVVGAQPVRSLAHVGELLVGLSAAKPREVVVDQVTGVDGHVSWIVTIPGTAELVSGDGEVFDARSNLELVDGGAADAVVMVLAAMERAGVRPEQPVMLAGHSQGGLVANAIAAAKTPYEVTTVLTLGAPSGASPHHPDVHYLHVENEPDLVPALDGADNPRTPMVVTAVVDSRASADHELAASSLTVAGAHGAAAYAWGLSLLDADSSASMSAWRSHAAQFLAGETTVRTVVSQVHGREGPSVSPAWYRGSRP